MTTEERAENADSPHEWCEYTCGKRGCVSRRKNGAGSHGAVAYVGGCRCEICKAAEFARVDSRRSAINSRTREKATHHGRQWTAVEMEVVVRDDLTAQEMADLLGRTLLAVKRMRYRMTQEPKLQNAAGAVRPSP